MVSYVLAGYRKGDRKAAEASLKYVIYGGVASGTMLFGMSWLYGLPARPNVLEFGARLAGVLRCSAGPGAAAATKLALVVAWSSCSPGSATRSRRCRGTCGAPTCTRARRRRSPRSSRSARRRPASRSRSASSTATLAGPPGADGLVGGARGIPWPAVVGVLSAITMTLGNFSALGQTT